MARPHRIVDVSIYTHNPVLDTKNLPPKKVTTTIVFDGDDENIIVEEFLSITYGWRKGLHYEEVVINTNIEKTKEANKMAKKKVVAENQEIAESTSKINTDNIEEAQVISETAPVVDDNKEPEVEDAVVVEEDTSANGLQDTKYEAVLPAIPDVFIVKGKTHSLAQVADIKKRATELKTKATPETYSDKKFWASIDDLRIEAKDQRTKLESQRKVLVKPINDALAKIKASTDEIGSKAKEVEDDLDALIAKKDNWVEEQAKIEKERIAKRTEDRKEQLRGINGIYSVDSGIFTFDYAVGDIINLNQLSTLSDEDFKTEFDYIKDLYDKEVAAKEEAERAAKEEAEKLAQKAKEDAEALAKKDEQILGMRDVMLTSAGYTVGAVNGSKEYTKNGYALTEREVIEMSNEDFFTAFQLHNNPKEEEVSKESDVKEVVSNNMLEVDIPSDVLEDKIDVEVKESNLFESPPYDPLGDVVSSMVDKHVEHQEKVDDIKRIELVFSTDDPYQDIKLGRSTLRITHYDFEDLAQQNMDVNSEVIAKNRYGNLIFLVLGASKKK